MTITYADDRTETLTVEEFRRRRNLVWCSRCDSYHPPGRCAFVPVTAAARRRAATFTPTHDGIDG